MTEENENVAGAKCVITQKKIDNLFKMIQLYKRPSLVAKMLGVDKRTFESWIEKGNEVLASNKDFNSELTDCVIDGLIYTQEFIDDSREEFLAQFLKDTYATEINMKNAGRFNEYLNEIAEEILEARTNKEESDMIDKFVFHEHDGKNESLKKYVKVARIVARADLAMKGKYLANIDKHAGTGKNVGLSKWMMEITDDEFKAQPISSVNIENNGTISFIDLVSKASLEKEKENT